MKHTFSKDSHAFVRNMLEALQLTMTDEIFSPKTALGRYLKALHGSSHPKRILYRENGEQVEFSTHEVLDTWHKANEHAMSPDETVSST